jgi:predicted unusual protein kinase regulating ubiquinone biosynthesis (AarF/ABC1/UbiB family)
MSKIDAYALNKAAKRVQVFRLLDKAPHCFKFSFYFLDLQRIFDSAELAMAEEAAAAALSTDSQKTSSYKMPWDGYTAVNQRRKRFSAVSFDLNRVFFVYPFLVPDYFALITRAMVVLEGIAVTGDPDFDLFSSAYPYALKRAVQMFGVASVGQIAKEAVAKVRRDARVRKEHEANQI